MIGSPIFATASVLAAAIREREISAREVVDAYLAQIARHNPALNAIVTLDEEGGRRRAAEADAALARGEIWGPLHGVPITLKDGHSTAGMRTTAGHLPLAAYVPEADGAVAGRLRRAGAIILGKTNVPPLLMDIQTDNRIFGRTNNPWDLARTPGGSSGGAAAALAAGLIPLDIGSDYAGSIRIPAHFCGLYGFKPTANRVPASGHIPDLPGEPRGDRHMASIGPLARSMEDLALAYRIIAGADAGDPESVPASTLHPPARPLSDLRVAWAPTFPGMPADAATRRVVQDLAGELAHQGARVAESLPRLNFDEQTQVRSRLAKCVEAAFAPPGEGSPPSLAEYLRLLHQRDAFIAAWEAFFAAWDIFLCPVAMIPAFEHCATGTPLPVDGQPEKYWRIIGHCTPFNLTGHPVVVLPAGRAPDGMPIGVQVVAGRWNDEEVLQMAALISTVLDPWRPPPGY